MRDFIGNASLILKIKTCGREKTFESITIEALDGDERVDLKTGIFIRVTEDFPSLGVSKGRDLKIVKLHDPTRHRRFVAVEVPGHPEQILLALEHFEQIEPKSRSVSSSAVPTDEQAFTAAHSVN